MEKKQEPQEDIQRKFLSYFILFFPTLIISVIPSQINGAVYLSFAIKLLLAFYQFITIKNFVDRYYGE